MENGNIPIAAAVIVGAVIIAASCFIAISDEDKDDGGTEPVYKYMVGLGELDYSDSSDAAEVDKIIDDISSLICGKYHDGFTLYIEKGATWVGGGTGLIDSVAYDKTTLVFEIAYLDDATAESLFNDMQNVAGTHAILEEKYYADIHLFIPSGQ